MVARTAAGSLLGSPALFAALLLAPFVHAQQASAPSGPPPAFADATITLRNGVGGRAIGFASANPRNYEDIVQRRELPPVTLQAKLFMPRRQGRVPAVIIAPGSGGLNPSQMRSSTRASQCCSSIRSEGAGSAARSEINSSCRRLLRPTTCWPPSARWCVRATSTLRGLAPWDTAVAESPCSTPA